MAERGTEKLDRKRCTSNRAGIMINAYFSGATGNGLSLSYDEGRIWNRIQNFVTPML